MMTKKLFIDGAWVDGSEGKTFKSINPATGEVIAEIAEERPDITVCKVNVDDEPALAARFSVKYIPTLAVIKDGKLLVSASGCRDKAGVLKLIEDALK